MFVGEEHVHVSILFLKGMELVIGDMPTDIQFNVPRRYCGNYAQTAKAMFVERMTCM